MAAIVSTEPIGDPARLGRLRLGASRLGGCPPASELTSTGLYSWVRSDGFLGDVNDGQPANAASGGWTTVRS